MLYAKYRDLSIPSLSMIGFIYLISGAALPDIRKQYRLSVTISVNFKNINLVASLLL